jgi:multidrug transporter EmrE-like cation transporter
MSEAAQAMTSPRTLAILMILFTVTTNAAAQIMLKQGMTLVGPVGFGGSPVQTVLGIAAQPWVIAGLCTFVVSMASHLVVLSRVELSFAYPFLSLAYVMVAAYSFFVFGEDITALRLLGYAVICIGTIIIAMS